MVKKKIAIITLYGNANYGNKLQNYAVQEVLKRFNLEPITIKNIPELNKKDYFIIRYILFIIKLFFHRVIKKDNKYTNNEYNNNLERTHNFIEFDKNIKTTKNYFNYINRRKYNHYDYYCVGSDQIWNPNYGCLTDFDLLGFVDDDKIKFSLSASFGVSQIDDKIMHEKKELFKRIDISVREDSGRNILNKYINNRIEVLIDPTMLLDIKDWERLEEKVDTVKKEYILVYFLGEISDDYYSYINNIAIDYDYEIINISDKNSIYYKCGPSQFLWLEHNASLICTDSFHSCVFSILYKRPFIIFERKDNLELMNSRLETLINKFQLSDRSIKNIKRNHLFDIKYDKCYKILEIERKKSLNFIKKNVEKGN